MIQAVLFDNDGVLVDTESIFYRVTREAFGRLGRELTQQCWAERYLGAGESSRDIAISMGVEPGKAVEVLEARNRHYREVLRQAPPLRPGVIKTLTALQGRVKLAIVTGCDREQFALVHRNGNLLGFFDLIVTSSDCRVSKPDPEPYLNAVRALGLKAEDCLAVEDSPRGLASARGAGVSCVVVPTELTRGLSFPGALAIEDELKGVLKHLEFGLQ